MNTEIVEAVRAACKELYGLDVEATLTRPEEQFGDYSINEALQLAGKLQRNPRGVAEELAMSLRKTLAEQVSEVTVAGPGFINFRLSDEVLLSSLSATLKQSLEGKKILLEYSNPNAFKELHTGHLYQTVVGDAIGRILEAAGAKVFRANFGGDVGLHVAKCLYGIIEKIGGENPEKLQEVSSGSQPSWIGEAYVIGARAYEDDDAAKNKIAEINSQIYIFHSTEDKSSNLAKIYWICRQWSYEYFQEFYKKIQVEPFDRFYPESKTIEPGLKLVHENVGKVFTESDGAIIYDEKKSGLHTRVFVTAKQLPTYEAKDLGVIFTEIKDFAYDQRVLMTGNEQVEYMKVVFAALNEIDAELARKQVHITNGTVRFGSGQKMSSRLGNVTRAVDVIDRVCEVVSDENPGTDYYSTSLAAIKYSFLNHRLGSDIAFDIDESVSLEGNSGPYLQYAHARARSILAKVEGTQEREPRTGLEADERSLVRKLSEYPEVVDKAVTDRLPHHICTYLYELAQTFNRFYENNRVLGNERESLRLELVTKYANTLRNGLMLLGIASPDKM